MSVSGSRNHLYDGGREVACRTQPSDSRGSVDSCRGSVDSLRDSVVSENKEKGVGDNVSEKNAGVNSDSSSLLRSETRAIMAERWVFRALY